MLRYVEALLYSYGTLKVFFQNGTALEKTENGLRWHVVFWCSFFMVL